MFLCEKWFRSGKELKRKKKGEKLKEIIIRWGRKKENDAMGKERMGGNSLKSAKARKQSYS